MHISLMADIYSLALLLSLMFFFSLNKYPIILTMDNGHIIDVLSMVTDTMIISKTVTI